MDNSMFGKYSTKQMNTVSKCILSLPGIVYITNSVIDCMNPNVHLPVMLISFSTIIASAYISSIISKGKNFAYDTKEVLKLYREFIKNYNKLNTMFEFNNPLQVYELYYYMYTKGYLSKDKNFEFKNTWPKDEIVCLGTQLIDGVGVCRNISALLVDILNDYNMSSINLSVIAYSYTVEFNNLKTVHSKEELISLAKKKIFDEERLKMVLSFIDDFEDFNYDISIVDRIFLGLIANHMITYTNFDGNSYYLDPTNHTTYRRNPKDGQLYSTFSKSKIREDDIMIVEDKKRHKEFEKLAKSDIPSISREEEKRIILSTRELIHDNKDALERFYKENKELYSDISSKLLQLK